MLVNEYVSKWIYYYIITDNHGFNIAQQLLALCDNLRDERLPGLGVLMEDQGGRRVLKYVGKEFALKEKEKKALALAEKQRNKDEQKKKEEELKVRS